MIVNNIKKLALAALASVACLMPASAGTAWNDLKAGNPVLPGYFADPCVRKFGDTYYLYVTPDGWDVGKGPYCIWTSKDFVHWKSHPSNWPTTELKWAPSVIKHNNKYYMYTQTPCMIWGAVSDTPLGPWTSLSEPGKPMIPDQTPKGSIVLDGEIFIDDDGQRYMWYSTWWTPTVAKLKEDMATIDGEPIQYFKKGDNKTPMGLVQGCMEAPYMFKHNGTYYLMYSNNFCQDSSYRVEYSTSSSPLGPFTYGKNNPILSTSDDDTVDGPGHHTILEDNGKIYIVYHRHDNPHDPDGAHRQTCIDELHFLPDGSIEKVVPTHSGVGFLAPSTVRDTNLAIGKTATASSFAGADFKPGYAADENNGTLWKAKDDSFPQWLMVDLGKQEKVARVETEFQYAQVLYSYLIECSSDGKTWKMFADRTKNTSWGPTVDKANVTARYFRITILGKNTDRKDQRAAIWNLKIYDGIDKPNQAPKVDAGPDVTGTSSFSTLLLGGKVYDDGLPNGPVTTLWQKVSGPGTVTFRNVDRLETYATFSTEGKYVLKLIANDGQYTSADTIVYDIKPLGDKLISYNFNEREGAVALDASGSVQNGYFKNQATRGTGVTGKALTLGGKKEYVEVPALLKTDRLTIAAWVKLDSFSNFSAIIGANTPATRSEGYPQLAINHNGEIQLSVSRDPGAQANLSTTNTSDFQFTDQTLGRWTHIACVYDSVAKKVEFYVNGKLDSMQNSVTAQPLNLGLGLRIGATPHGGYFAGKIDDLVIYNRTLSANEVKALASAAWVGIADANKLADGKPVTLKAKTVTYAARNANGKRCTSFFYIAEPDNSAVLRVQDGKTGQDDVDVENGVTVTGVMQTNKANGERYLVLTAPIEIESSPSVSSIAVNSTNIAKNSSLDGRVVTFTAKVTSISADAKILTMQDGTIVKSLSDPIKLVEAGNTVSITGLVSKVNKTQKTVLLRDIRIIDPAIPPIKDGLVAWYSLDEKSGNTVSDSSDRHNNASLGGGAVWASGRLGNAINLDGRGGHFTLPQAIMMDVDDFTISMWVKLDSTPVFSRLFDFGSGTGKYMMLCNVGDRGLRYAITLKGNGEDGEKVCDADKVLTIGAWKHVVVTQKGYAVTMFVDGAKVAENPNIRLKPSDLGVTTQNWIGRSQYGDATLDGKVDDVRIYNRVLTPSEITQIYNGY